MTEKKQKITITSVLETVLALTKKRFQVIDSNGDDDGFGIHVKEDKILLETPWFMISGTESMNCTCCGEYHNITHY